MTLEQILRDLKEGDSVRIIETSRYEIVMLVVHWFDDVFDAWIYSVDNSLLEGVSLHCKTMAKFLVRCQVDFDEDLTELEWVPYRKRAKIERENIALKERIAELEKVLQEK